MGCWPPHRTSCCSDGVRNTANSSRWTVVREVVCRWQSMSWQRARGYSRSFQASLVLPHSPILHMCIPSPPQARCRRSRRTGCGQCGEEFILRLTSLDPGCGWPSENGIWIESVTRRGELDEIFEVFVGLSQGSWCWCQWWLLLIFLLFDSPLVDLCGGSWLLASLSFESYGNHYTIPCQKKESRPKMGFPPFLSHFNYLEWLFTPVT